MIRFLIDAAIAITTWADRTLTAAERRRTVTFPEHGLKFDPQHGWMND